MSEHQSVRFIGGPRDGLLCSVDVALNAISVPDNALQLNYVRNQPRTTKESTVTYTRRNLSLQSGAHEFFAPTNWSDERALAPRIDAPSGAMMTIFRLSYQALDSRAGGKHQVHTCIADLAASAHKFTSRPKQGTIV
jgi:hypothetical protein